MTPLQKRKNLQALQHCASAPRKSWLGRFTPLNDIQSAWVKALLCAWGETYGGRTCEERSLDGGHITPREFWARLSAADWTEERAEQITTVINELHSSGLRGEALLCTACQKLFPGSLAAAIGRAADREHADFMEEAILSAFTRDDPVRLVGMNYYTRHQKVSDIARSLQLVAPWLTPDKARERAKWALQVFRAKVFLAVRQKMQMN